MARLPDPVSNPARRRVCAALALWPALGAVAASRPAAAATAATAAPLLAREWPADADPVGYLVSEKFDGVRALWDGRRLRFRSGRPLAAPAWFLARLPAQPLDGELWLGRGRFEALAATVRRETPDDGEWRALRYQLFELPGAGGRFDDRAAALVALVASVRRQGWDALQAVEQAPVADRAALARRLEAVVAAGGEGLMLHRADAPEAGGRGPWLWKHKPLHDAEAVVVGHRPGRGRLAGRLGALAVRDEQGRSFDIGTGFSDADRAAPPAVGSRVTYTHRGFTAQGRPRFASFLRLAPVF